MKNCLTCFAFLSLVLLIACSAPPPTDTSSAKVSQSEPAAAPQSGYSAFNDEIAKLSGQAKESYPSARDRYLKGLPSGCQFFVSVIITDNKGQKEQVYVRVEKIADKTISGAIANEVVAAKGFQKDQNITISENEILDWTIAYPDGTIEGNLIGKYMDSQQGK